MYPEYGKSHDRVGAEGEGKGNLSPGFFDTPGCPLSQARGISTHADASKGGE